MENRPDYPPQNNLSLQRFLRGLKQPDATWVSKAPSPANDFEAFDTVFTEQLSSIRIPVSKKLFNKHMMLSEFEALSAIQKLGKAAPAQQTQILKDLEAAKARHYDARGRLTLQLTQALEAFGQMDEPDSETDYHRQLYQQILRTIDDMARDVCQGKNPTPPHVATLRILFFAAGGVESMESPEINLVTNSNAAEELAQRIVNQAYEAKHHIGLEAEARAHEAKSNFDSAFFKVVANKKIPVDEIIWRRHVALKHHEALLAENEETRQLAKQQTLPTRNAHGNYLLSYLSAGRAFNDLLTNGGDRTNMFSPRYKAIIIAQDHLRDAVWKGMNVPQQQGSIYRFINALAETLYQKSDGNAGTYNVAINEASALNIAKDFALEAHRLKQNQTVRRTRP
ncbi:MAG: hypothetical protein ACOYNL_03795 [Rickettsiales bacterium]